MASYIVTNKIRVNIVHGVAVPPRVKCEQYDGDYTRQIEATIYNGDELYVIPSLVRRIVVSGLKPDATGFSYDCTWSGSKVLFSLMRQMTVIPGDVVCNISMFDASNNQVSSAVFVLAVEKAALPSDVVVSSNDFQTFVDYVQAAHLYSEYSKSYAVGNTGVRENENTDNSQYYAHLAKTYKGSPLVARTVEEMEHVDRVYVYVGSESGYENGHWYYYNDSEWADGGVYNAQGVQTDTELITPDMAADAEATGLRIRTLENQNGDDELETEAQTHSGAINELHGIVGDSLNNNAFENLCDAINKLDVIVTPEMYGAVGDGVTDDSAAIATASQHGFLIGNVEKIYRIESEIILAGSTMNMNFSMKDTIMMRISSNTIHVNDSFEVPLSEVQAHSGRGDSVLYISSKENVVFKNCKWLRSTNFVTVHSCKNVLFDGCLFWRAYQTAYASGGNGYALLCTDANENLKVVNCTFKSIGRHAIYLSKDSTEAITNKYIIIDNNVFDWSNISNEEISPQGIGTDVAINIRYSEHVKITNNSFVLCDSCVKLVVNENDLIDDVIIANNNMTVRNGSNYAVVEAPTTGHKATNILVDNNYIKVLGSAVCLGKFDGKISNNTIIGNEGINVKTGNTNQKCIIENNIFNCTKDCIGTSSSDNVIAYMALKNNYFKCTNTIGIYTSGGSITTMLVDGNTFESPRFTNDPISVTDIEYIGNTSVNQSSLVPCFRASGTVKHSLESTFAFT